jgi:hypothetical protein
MADIVITSFDLDTAGAVRQTQALAAEVAKLEKELVVLQKEGKDTTETQKKFAAATANLDKVLAQETKTMKGTAAQTAALVDVTNKSSAAVNNATNAQGKLDAASKKSAVSTASLIGRSKSLTQVFTRGAGAVANLAGGFGLSGIALGALSGVAEKAISSLYSFFGASESVVAVQQSVAEATKAVAAEYVQEARDLNGLLAPLSDANTSSSDRAKLIDEIQKRYPEYLKGLGDEAFSIQNIADTQKILNERLIDGIVIKAREAEQTKLTAKIVENQIQIERLRAQGLLETQNIAEASTKGVFATVNAAFGSLSEGLTDAEKLTRSLQFAQLEKDQVALAAESQNLDKTFQEVAKSLKGLNIDLGQNASVATAVTSATDKESKARTTNSKAVKDQSDAIAKLNQETEKERELRRQEREEADLFATSLGGLKKALSEIENQIQNATSVKDFAEFRRLSDEAEQLKKEINLVETAIKSLNQTPPEIKKPDDFSAVQSEVEAAKLALGELRNEQAKADLERAQREGRALARVRGNAQSETAVRISFAKQAETAKRIAAEETLKAQIAIAQAEVKLAAQTGEIFGQEATDARAELLRLQTELAQLNNEQFTANIDIKVNEQSAAEAKEKVKQTVLQIADFAQTIANQVTDFAKSSNDQTIASLDKSIETQKGLLDQLLNNVDTANVEQVRLEQERLDKLNAEREKAKNREAQIAQAQIAINLALAVARAVAEGGGLASALTVAAAISAAIFGFIQARQAAANAYADGTMFVDDSRAPQGTDTIPAMLDRGESVFTKKKTKQYNPMLRAIFNGSIPAKEANDFAQNYAQGKAENSGFFVALPTRSTGEARSDYEMERIARRERQSGGGGQLDLAKALTYIGQAIAEKGDTVLRGSELHKVVQNKASKLDKLRNKSKGA